MRRVHMRRGAGRSRPAWETDDDPRRTPDARRTVSARQRGGRDSRGSARPKPSSTTPFAPRPTRPMCWRKPSSFSSRRWRPRRTASPNSRRRRRMRRRAGQEQGSFLGNLGKSIFGGGAPSAPPPPRQTMIKPIRSSSPAGAGYAPPPPPGYAPQRPGPRGGRAAAGALIEQGAPAYPQQGGGGFLQNAASTAAGVAGGVAIGNLLGGLFGGHSGGGLFGGGAQRRPVRRRRQPGGNEDGQQLLRIRAGQGRPGPVRSEHAGRCRLPFDNLVVRPDNSGGGNDDIWSAAARPRQGRAIERNLAGPRRVRAKTAPPRLPRLGSSPAQRIGFDPSA